MYIANWTGFGLAVASSAFIGSSFIIKKKGLQKAGASGTRASSGGYGYLREPLWWIGMVTMIVGEFANFVAYIYAPAVLVTPLGALSIIVSAVLAHFILKEKLKKLGVLGCLLCIVGSVVIVFHAPREHDLNSVDEIWALATQPAFLLYTASAVAITLVLVLYCEPRLWSDKYYGLYWCLLHHWVLDDLYAQLSPQISWLIHANGEIWKQKEDGLHSEFVAIIRQDHFK